MIQKIKHKFMSMWIFLLAIFFAKDAYAQSAVYFAMPAKITPKPCLGFLKNVSGAKCEKLENIVANILDNIILVSVGCIAIAVGLIYFIKYHIKNKKSANKTPNNPEATK